MEKKDKPKTGWFFRLHSIGITLALFSFCLSTSPAMATPPARQEHYVRWEKLKQMSIQFFPKEARQFVKQVEGNLEPALPGSERQHLRNGHALFNGIVGIVIPSLISQQATQVKTYFQKVSENRLIEGSFFQRGFSGETFVRIQLTSGSQQEYRVNFEDWAAGKKKGKSPVFTLSYPIGIRILPLYDRGDVFVFNSVNHLRIRNIPWGKRYGPENPACFIAEKELLLQEIGTMHWPYKEGMSSGVLSLKREDGSILGPWETETLPNFGGANHVAWVCRPGIVFKSGAYEIVDSDPDSWMNNSQSELGGMGWVIASPIKSF